MDEPRAGQEVECDVVEGVFDDLGGLRLDPQRDQRHLVHHPFQFCCLGLVFGRGLVPRPSLLTVEEFGRVVLDAERVAAIDRLVAHERVRALFEPEAEEVGGRDELRLTRLTDEAVNVARCRRRLVVGRAARRAVSRSFARLQKVVLVLPPVTSPKRRRR